MFSSQCIGKTAIIDQYFKMTINLPFIAHNNDLKILLFHINLVSLNQKNPNIHIPHNNPFYNYLKKKHCFIFIRINTWHHHKHWAHPAPHSSKHRKIITQPARQPHTRSLTATTTNARISDASTTARTLISSLAHSPLYARARIYTYITNATTTQRTHNAADI